MSTMNQKVEAVTSVLKDNARQFRLTNRQELATEAGRRLFQKGQKKSDTPIERYKLIEVLDRVAQRAENGILLNSLVVHYRDSRPGRRFTDWAQQAGASTNHAKAVNAVFNAYGDSYVKSIFAGISNGKHAAMDDSYDEDVEDYEDDIDPDDRDEND